MAKDNDAIERIRNNQNRIQSTNLTNQESQFFNNENNIGKYEEIEEGSSGTATGSGFTNKVNFLNLIKKGKKIGKYVGIAIVALMILMVVVIATIFTNEDWKGFFLTDNVKNGSSSNGSSSSSIKTPSGTKTSLATISDIYKSTLIENESFFADLKRVAKNYTDYALPDGTDLFDGEFDIAIVAATIHYNKFISDATVLSGAFSSARSQSNMGMATTRRLSHIPTYEVKSFYELASITLGTDLGIPEEQYRGITGHLVGSKVQSICLSKSDAKTYLSNGRIGSYDLLDSIIIKYESLYYSGAPSSSENDYTRTLKRRLDALRENGTFSDYYDTSEYDPDIECGGKTAVHFVSKYMNYETYAKYLLTEYVPENYLECVDCKSSNKRNDSIEITKSIFDNRNQFVSYYYDDEIIDVQKFPNGDSLTTTKSEYQLPDEIKNNFTSPFGLSTKCTISSGFTSNRTGYSHYAVDAYANDRTLYSVADGVVIATVSNVSYSLNVTNGVCLDSNGNIDSRSAGNYVAIKHTIDGKDYVSYYMHMENVIVKPGQKVSKGEKIGLEGTTGCSTGYHVHFQLVSGSTRYDPTLLFSQCAGASIVNYSSTSMTEFLNNTFKDYTYTNINGCNVKVYDDKEEKSYSAMTLEEYVAGVVNNEMPGSYNIEALKAQAIAARSFHVANSNYCSKRGITQNNENYQTFSKVNPDKDANDNAVILATRDTAGMLESYANGVYATEYANFPCEIVYRCTDPDRYEPYFVKSVNAVTCRDKIYGTFDSSKVYKTSNGEEGTKSETACPKDGSKGSIYYCGNTNYPRQFRNQSNIVGEVGGCDELSVELKPHASYGARYRTIAVPHKWIKVGTTAVYQGSSWQEDYSPFYGHNRGMSQILANYYAVHYGWNYKRILSYFYNQKIGYNLVTIETPTILLDDQTEYEANDYNGRITMTIGNRDLLVPVDFYVAGMLYSNFGANTNSNLLKALAISNRTLVYNKTQWGHDKIVPSGQYSFEYTDNKTIYDAINATKNTLLVDSEGYITPTGYYHTGSDGTITKTGKETTITYELGYQYKDDTHKVMIKYDENFYNLYSGLSSGNIGIIHDVATYMTNNWYFVNHFEILKFFYGEDYNVVDINGMSTKGDIKDENGNIIKYQGGTININSAALDALNSDLENYVSENGYGTINGVVAAAEWLWKHAQGDGELYVPYVLGGQHPPITGINSVWYNSDNLTDGVDCTGFLFWSFKNGGYPSITFSGMRKRLQNIGQLNRKYYYDFEESDVKTKGIPLIDFIDEIAPGDVLWHYQGEVYNDSNGKGSTYAHAAIVSEVDRDSGTITIIHAGFNYKSGDKITGIKKAVINAYTGQYSDTGHSHTYTAVIRFSQIPEGWLR